MGTIHIVWQYDTMGLPMNAVELESFQHLRASMPIGSRSPLYAGASSKRLLAFSERSFIDRYLKGTALKAVTAHTIADPGGFMEELQTIRQWG